MHDMFCFNNTNGSDIGGATDNGGSSGSAKGNDGSDCSCAVFGDPNEVSLTNDGGTVSSDGKC